MKTIVLFTGSYPYSVALEDTFIEPELEILDKYFKIIIIPLSKKGSKSDFILKLKNTEVIEDFEEFNKYKEIYALLKINKYFFDEFKYTKSVYHFRDLISAWVYSKWFEKIIIRYLELGRLSEDYLYYTYWFSPATTALLNLKDKFSLKVISRTHRYDLYEERRMGYIPFRKRDVEKIDKIVTISMQGYNYLKRKYNLQNLYNSYLGIKDLNIENPLNNTLNLKIVSCSLMSPVKRIDLIMEYLSKVSKDLKIQIEWHHIGAGILEKKLKQKKDELQHKNFKIIFTGFLENKKIFEYYKHNPFDYFITLSESEGLPVSLMEACSVSLPIIATNVGGINEIVENEVNGFLLSPNPSYQEFKDTFIKAINLKNNLEKFISLRKNSRKIYMKKFNSEINHEKFAKFLGEFR